MSDRGLNVGNSIVEKFTDLGDGTYAARVDVGSNVPVSGTVYVGGTSATDRSGTITSGGNAQNAIAVNTARHEWTFVNSSDTLMLVNAAGTATATAGIPVYPGDVASGAETNAISVYCATTGKAFTAWER